ncbi:MAG: methylenetetrahydrofolate reductase [Bacteroidales bacterium]|nr:methylenetetrahydrofolate reductase [Bacteroidales bacterium]
MKVTEHIKQAKGKTLFSFEILPPLKGEHFEDIYKNISPLLEFKPSFINVTYHQQELIYKNLPNGYLERKTIRHRPGTVGISAALQFKTGIDVVPHLICGGFSQEDTEEALIDLHFLSIHNILLVRGDAPLGQKYFIPEKDGHQYTEGLVNQVSNLNKGIYLDEEIQETHPTEFCIGIAGYPEKHIEAPNMLTDLKFLKQKVEAGAEYIVTQLFFDNQKFFDFEKQCRAIGITIPIIPGLKPITTKRQLLTLPQTFNIDIPDELVNEVQKCSSNKEVREVGVKWSIKQSQELMDFGVPVLHFFTMGKTDNIQKIAKVIFKD